MITLSILVGSALLLVVLTLWKRRSPARLRTIPAFTRLVHTLGLSIEDGKRLHISLGHGNLLDGHGGSALAGLATLRTITERTSVSDMPSVASAGDPTLGLLTQDTTHAGYKAAAVEEMYNPTAGRVTGLTPFSYAAGAMHITANENVSTNILVGHFGPEAALLADAAERSHATTIGASDNITGQAVLFAGSQEALIGEELFAAGAYLGNDASHAASLTVQDILRWLVVLVMVGGAIGKFIGAF